MQVSTKQLVQAQLLCRQHRVLERGLLLAEAEILAIVIQEQAWFLACQSDKMYFVGRLLVVHAEVFSMKLLSPFNKIQLVQMRA
jgi:hypothetical protein